MKNFWPTKADGTPQGEKGWPARLAPGESKQVLGSKGAVYTLKHHLDGGGLSCDCPSWKLQPGKHPKLPAIARTCKHLDAEVGAGEMELHVLRGVEVLGADYVPRAERSDTIAENPTQMPPAYVINLADRPDRLATFQRRAQSAQLHASPFHAIDSRGDALDVHRDAIAPAAYAELMESMARGYRSRHAALTPGAVGCALSHAAVSEAGLLAGHQTILVFEDDADLPADLVPRVGTALGQVPRGWDALLLGWSDRGGSTDQCRSGGMGLKRVGRFWMLHAYALSRGGMRKLVDACAPVTEQLDSALSTLSTAGRMRIYGIADEAQRVPQDAPGSDVQSLPVRFDEPRAKRKQGIHNRCS